MLKNTYNGPTFLILLRFVKKVMKYIFSLYNLNAVKICIVFVLAMVWSKIDYFEIDKHNEIKRSSNIDLTKQNYSCKNSNTLRKCKGNKTRIQAETQRRSTTTITTVAASTTTTFISTTNITQLQSANAHYVV